MGECDSANPGAYAVHNMRGGLTLLLSRTARHYFFHEFTLFWTFSIVHNYLALGGCNTQNLKNRSERQIGPQSQGPVAGTSAGGHAFPS